RLGKSAGVNAIAGPLVIGNSTGAADSDIVRLLADNQIPTSVAITVNASGRLGLDGNDDTIGPLTLVGGHVLTFDSGTNTYGTLTLSADVTTNASSVSAQIGGKLSLGSTTRTFTIALGQAAPDLDITADIID